MDVDRLFDMRRLKQTRCHVGGLHIEIYEAWRFNADMNHVGDAGEVVRTSQDHRSSGPTRMLCTFIEDRILCSAEIGCRNDASWISPQIRIRRALEDELKV